MSHPTAIIVGAGPAGLTAAYELLQRTDIRPIVLEQSTDMGGLCRTINYRGNRIDIGGHRFFSKSDRVMQWWLSQLPIQRTDQRIHWLKYHGQSDLLPDSDQRPDPDKTDRVMLIRPRKSRIYWQRKLFDYPLSLSRDTIRKMGLWRLSRAASSYVWSSLRPIRPERHLEDFLINRFGGELYRTFFKSYSEKVWGVPCREIPAAWGAQRIKGLSIRKAILHALSRSTKRSLDVAQKHTETSLIETFLYPKFGPGQMWETVAEKIRARGGQIFTEHCVTRFQIEGRRIVAVEACHTPTGQSRWLPADLVCSSMPVKELIRGLGEHASSSIRQIADNLPYRDFFTVGLLTKTLKLQDAGGPIRDNWIYIQEPDVLIGRLQIFNNWSPYMVADPALVWLGLEYFCNETEDIWSWPDDRLIDLGKDELRRLNIIDPHEVVDGCVIRTRKTYPAYFGAYSRFSELREYLDHFQNLYCLGRNGQHRYNNQDHSMLTAMIAVDNIVEGRADKSNVWDVNVEEEYHESRRHQPGR
jgi:protoporphyrinogen oxidase